MSWSGGSYRKGNYGTNGWIGDASLGIGIEAGRHDTQDDDFANGINACMAKDGSNAATGNLNIGGNKITNVGSATASTDVPTYSQLLAIIPPGTITAYGGGSAPTGWFLCTGTAVNRVTYAALFAIIGTSYGSGDGSTTFNLPNLQQRFPLGKSTSGTGATLGSTGGAIDHTHTSAAHTHTVASHVHTLSDSGAAKVTYSATDTMLGRVSTASWNHTATTSPDVPWGSSTAAQTSGAGLIGSTDGTSLTTDSTTPGATGSNNPPFQTVNYIIKS